MTKYLLKNLEKIMKTTQQRIDRNTLSRSIVFHDQVNV